MVEGNGLFARLEVAWRGWVALRALRSRAVRLARERKLLDEESLREYIEKMRLHPDYPAIQKARRISMLHEDVLTLLYHFAATSKGRILEIGPYVGGSTTALGTAIRRYAKTDKLISIELGGRLDHVDIPSNDILGDLKRNLSRLGVRDSVELLEGSSYSPEIVESVKRLVGSGYIDLLFIDADGHVERDTDTYRPLLRDGTLLVLDDYHSPGNPEKGILVKAWVDAAVAQGRVKSLGVWGWGTWVGIYLDQASKSSTVTSGRDVATH
jgi:predicted O-methyltransferase YrrM